MSTCRRWKPIGACWRHPPPRPCIRASTGAPPGLRRIPISCFSCAAAIDGEDGLHPAARAGPRPVVPHGPVHRLAAQQHQYRPFRTPASIPFAANDSPHADCRPLRETVARRRYRHAGEDAVRMARRLPSARLASGCAQPEFLFPAAASSKPSRRRWPAQRQAAAQEIPRFASGGWKRWAATNTSSPQTLGRAASRCLICSSNRRPSASRRSACPMSFQDSGNAGLLPRARRQSARHGDGQPLELNAIRLRGRTSGRIVAIAGLSRKGDHVICQFGSIDEDMAARRQPRRAVVLPDDPQVQRRRSHAVRFRHRRPGLQALLVHGRDAPARYRPAADASRPPGGIGATALPCGSKRRSRRTSRPMPSCSVFASGGRHRNSAAASDTATD